MESHGQQKAIGGFIGWTLVIAGMTAFVLWSCLDEATLHSFGVTYYPDKYWAVALPGFFTMAFLYYWSTYMLMYMRNTKPLCDMHCITDLQARGSKAELGTLSNVQSSVPPIADIPVNVASRVLHQPWK